MNRIFKRLWCNHHYHWKRNIYGDEIFARGGRSWWECCNCGKTIVRACLRHDSIAL